MRIKLRIGGSRLTAYGPWLTGRRDTQLMIRRALQAAGALLLLFHVWLLGRDAWSGELLEADRLLRWLAAIGLGALLVILYRQGVSILVGRKAVVIWLLAALLHGPAVAERLGVVEVPAMPVVTLTEVGVLSFVSGLGTLLFRRFWNAFRSRAHQPSFARFDLVDFHRPRAFAPGVVLHLVSRPPPGT